MQIMPFSGQLAQILVEGEEGEDKGCTVLHFGATYKPENVTCSTILTNVLPRGKYVDVIISGSVDHEKNKLAITSLGLPSC